jgi:predicted esterase
MNRREFGALAGGVIAACAAGAACDMTAPLAAQSDGRLSARPRPGGKTATAGVQALGLDASRDAWLQLPDGPTDAPLPLVVMLHGAGGNAERFLKRFAQAPADAGVALLVPSSRSSTWDAIRGVGPDVSFLDRALAKVFETSAIDPARVAIGGFSDGASYALTLGLINGDLFRRVIAFSPGFVVEGTVHGRAQFFISHGTADPILPIDRCSRRIVPDLRTRGYDVTFREFEGGHEVPPAIAGEAMTWAAGR